MSVVLVPGQVDLAALERIWRDGLSAVLDGSARAPVEAAARLTP